MPNSRLERLSRQFFARRQATRLRQFRWRQFSRPVADGYRNGPEDVDCRRSLDDARLVARRQQVHLPIPRAGREFDLDGRSEGACKAEAGAGGTIKGCGEGSGKTSTVATKVRNSSRHQTGFPKSQPHFGSPKNQPLISERRQPANLRRSPPPPRASGTAGVKKSRNRHVFLDWQTI